MATDCEKSEKVRANRGPLAGSGTRLKGSERVSQSPVRMFGRLRHRGKQPANVFLFGWVTVVNGDDQNRSNECS